VSGVQTYFVAAEGERPSIIIPKKIPTLYYPAFTTQDGRKPEPSSRAFLSPLFNGDALMIADTLSRDYAFSAVFDFNAVTQTGSIRPVVEHLDSAILTFVGSPQFGSLYGHSEAMRHTYEYIERVAQTDKTVLLHGETGTGKELVARAIHDMSARNGKPFVPVNASAINYELFESEMFGHAKGAFTGALAANRGLVGAANGGTLFIDEIAEMPFGEQSKLLRVLEGGNTNLLAMQPPIQVIFVSSLQRIKIFRILCVRVNFVKTYITVSMLLILDFLLFGNAERIFRFLQRISHYVREWNLAASQS